MRTVFAKQKQLVNHESAKLLAIRRITQDNLAKRAAKVPGKVARMVVRSCIDQNDYHQI